MNPKISKGSKARYDPKSLFPSIALYETLRNLELSEAMCAICCKSFSNFYNMIPKVPVDISMMKGFRTFTFSPDSKLLAWDEKVLRPLEWQL